MKWYFLLLAVMTMIGSIASLFLKRASGATNISILLTNKNLYLGAFLYLLSAVFNIIILRYLEYSVVLPLTSLTYVWTLIISYLVIKEKISKKKVIGVIMILVGAIFVSI